ncbi:MAG: SUMF1/EgtB/PvdO family nonheme iron enzyme [Acidobacteriota bacterium]|nr:SUMF1/EgtB/PvdO family nonheme iron enzyme [Acidobacteriota bacterium]
MQGGDTIVLIAALLSGEGSVARLDAGVADGLAVGDRGRVFYILTVGSDSSEVKVPVSEAEVVALEENNASVHLPSSVISPEYLHMELSIPVTRTKPISLASALAEHHLDQGRYERASGVIAAALEGSDEQERTPGVTRLLAVRDRVASRLEEIEGLARQVDVPTGPEALRMSRTEPGSMSLVPSGTYSFGVFLEKAEFYNQTPRHSRELRSYWIDRAPVSSQAYRRFKPEHVFSSSGRPFATGLTFEEAESFCTWRQSRLPSEFEWEAAVNTPGAVDNPLREWTVSWYEPYPGNSHPERHYGTTHRVVRGGAESAVETTVRLFLSPGKGASDVGFRCAHSKE